MILYIPVPYIVEARAHGDRGLFFRGGGAGEGGGVWGR